MHNLPVIWFLDILGASPADRPQRVDTTGQAASAVQARANQSNRAGIAEGRAKDHGPDRPRDCQAKADHHANAGDAAGLHGVGTLAGGWVRGEGWKGVGAAS